MTVPEFSGITGRMLCSECAAGAALPSTGTDASNRHTGLSRASHSAASD